MPNQSCGTCRHYQTDGFTAMIGRCHWLDTYQGMATEVPAWVIRNDPYPVYPREGTNCPQWQEALP